MLLNVLNASCRFPPPPDGSAPKRFWVGLRLFVAGCSKRQLSATGSALLCRMPQSRSGSFPASFQANILPNLQFPCW